MPESNFVGSPLVSGMGWKDTFGIISGFVIINNNILPLKNRKYYLIAKVMGDSGATKNYSFKKFGSNEWGENNIVAYQLQQ
jgi:hypothetical protein